MFHILANEKREEYLARFGQAYDPASFPSPELTPSDRLNLVASIKVCEASARQIDIHYELQRLPKAGDAALPDTAHEHLPADRDQQAEIIRVWASHA